ncbi:MAG: tetratricopeptide repeat protein [Rhodothermales bacterium]|nr:tetratricopeptide repeat protein [Rhodothermales bacterium]MBO6779618.1 tetratricopeptide repeat protein [Rhodothermales bacterium]
MGFVRPMGMRYLSLILLLLAGSATAQSWNGPYGSILDDPDTFAQGGRALQHLYDMNPAAARATIDSLKAAHPRHPIGPYLEGLTVWWEILPVLSVEDHSRDDEFFDAMNRTVRAAERLPRHLEMDKVFFKAAALGFRGRHLSNRYEWLRAARDGKEALDLVFDVSDRDPANPDFQFGMGVYWYFAEAIPEEYPVVKPVMYFFPDGDREKGLAELHRVAQTATFVGTEAAYFLLQIYMQYEPDFERSRDMVGLLRQRHPANAFFHTLEGRVLTRFGRHHSASEIYQEFLDLHAEGVHGYTDGLAHSVLYYLGRSHMSAGDLPAAVATFDDLETLAAGNEHSVYRAMGRLRAGMALDRLGRRQPALAAYRTVLSLPEVGDSHDQAKRYLKKPFGS